ncbi:MAG: SH3 domain-containing protein [Hydrogenophaga sp.]|nr:SH3 domain-containing protein [Hydrogenophaga sp.]
MLEKFLPTSPRFATAALAFALALPAGSALAQSMVSVRPQSIHMRDGPGTRHDALWLVSRGYPLKVVGRKGNWLKVRDFEGDGGWVSRPLTSTTPYHIVKVSKANLRSGPGTSFRIKGSVQYGETLRTLQKKDGWVKVRHDTIGQGWISRKLVWGW